MSHDPSYYAARAIEERRLAMTASNPAVRRVHLELAAQYALRAGTLSEINPAEQTPEGNRRTA